MKHIILFILAIALLQSCSNSDTDRQAQVDYKIVEGEKIDSVPAVDYLALGKSMVAASQAQLAGNLLKAIQAGGTANAMTFCNARAMEVTDSMALALHANVERVSDKPRNPVNQANEDELKYIKALKDKLAIGEKPTAIVTEHGGKMVGYYPIVTNQMCLQCHGSKGTDLKAATLKKLNELYPGDKATGYGENEVRGLWVIEIDKKIKSGKEKLYPSQLLLIK